MIVKFTKYSSVALGSAATDWLVFVALYAIGAHYIQAQMVARVAGGLFSFFVNKFWSFSVAGFVVTQGRRFLLLYAFSYGMSLGLLSFLVEVLLIPEFLAKLMSDATLFVINFLVMRLYVFNDGVGLLRGLGLAVARLRHQ